MSDLMFSVNVTLPVFIVLMLGYLLRRMSILNAEFVRVGNRFNYMVTLPALLVTDLAHVNIREVFELRYVGFCALSSAVCFFACWLIAGLCFKEGSTIGAFTQASFRSSAAVMGIAFIQNIYGDSAMGALMVLGSVPVYNILSVLVLTVNSKEYEGEKLSKVMLSAVVNMAKNPIILAIIAGSILGYLGNPVPYIVDNALTMTAKMATPLALITTGAGFEIMGAMGKFRSAMAATFIKLIGQALIFVPLAIHMGFDGEKLIGILIMLAAPTTPSCYIMAKHFGSDDTLTVSVVVATTFLAAITLTAWIFLIKAGGFITV